MGNDLIPYDFGLVYCVRCLDGLARLPDNCIDMIVTECPTSDDSYFEPCARVLKPTGAFYVRSADAGSWIQTWTHRLDRVGLAVIHTVKTNDFCLGRDFDYFLIGAKDEHRLRTNPPPLEFIHPKVPQEDRINSAQRDVLTYMDLVQLSTDENDIVLDICAGSAAVGVACIRTQRHYIGFDNNEKMVQEANKRLEAITNKIQEPKAELITGKKVSLQV